MRGDFLCCSLDLQREQEQEQEQKQDREQGHHLASARINSVLLSAALMLQIGRKITFGHTAINSKNRTAPP
jgi:hypothetical protein